MPLLSIKRKSGLGFGLYCIYLVFIFVFGVVFLINYRPEAALSAIRNLNEYELNGRKLRVNFSNSSHLEALATKLGMDVNQHQHQREIQKQQAQHEMQAARAAAMAAKAASTSSGPGVMSALSSGPSGGTSAVADALKAMSKAEMYDVIAKLKEIADTNPEEARRIISGHPQLPEALLFCMSKLDMVQTAIQINDANPAAAGLGVGAIGAPGVPAATPMPTATAVARPADPRARAADPRAAAAAAAATAAAAGGSTDPRKDPRKQQVAAPAAPTAVAAVDPRARASMMGSVPPPPQQQLQLLPPPPPPHLMHQQQMQFLHQQQQMPPPPPPPPQQHAMGGMPQLDPSLIQQVMSLTPQQIAQLPPEKQQGIMALRNQIAAAGLGR
jgi:cleavage stimulation factor subunit 2